MSEPAVDHYAAAGGKASRATMLLAGIWLVFLIPPVASQASRLGEPRVLLGTLASVLFAATYLWALVVHIRQRARGQMDMSLRQGYFFVLALVAEAGVLWFGLDQRGSGAIIYIAVIAALALPTAHALVAVPLVAAYEFLLSLLVPGWDVDYWTPAVASAAGFVMWGMKQIMVRNVELVLVRAENERLVVEQERNRFARDLHDILGHSLTVITVKTELARRLLDIDVEKARAELEDLENLSRESLADVRRAVQGYREITLPGEIARARLALAAAGIEHVLPNSTDDVPAHLRELFAWTIREGVTNVIRHSGAESCTVRLAHDRVTVVDDGRGSPNGTLNGSNGNGLHGLVERASVVGARLERGNAEPRGFRLEVRAG